MHTCIDKSYLNSSHTVPKRHNYFWKNARVDAKMLESSLERG